jgi:hypothetical protein
MPDFLPFQLQIGIDDLRDVLFGDLHVPDASRWIIVSTRRVLSFS